jgi:general secretion pathway protein A
LFSANILNFDGIRLFFTLLSRLSLLRFFCFYSIGRVFSMYLDYFGLKESPFSIAPDPAFFYSSSRHEMALAFLSAALGAGGIYLLSGDIGAGKTILCRSFLEQLPGDTEAVLVLNPCVSADELLETICNELGIALAPDDSTYWCFLMLKGYLLKAARGQRRLLLLIDEAQGLAAEACGQLRLLAKAAARQGAALVIVLFGQSELTELCRCFPDLDQWIIARFHLAPMEKGEIGAYVRHRLQVAGCERELFTRAAVVEVMRQADGVPRIINLICDRALLVAATRNETEVSAALVREAVDELSCGSAPVGCLRCRGPVVGVLLTLLLLILFVWQLHPDAVQDASMAGTADAIQGVPVSGSQLQRNWPGSFAFTVTREQAFEDLFRLWKLPYESRQEDPCVFARQNSLECYAKKATLNYVVGLNRPVILTLYRDSGEPFYVVLSGLVDREARLLAAGQERVLDIQALESCWFGEYLLLWKPPASSELLRPGEINANLIWLESRLKALGLYSGKEQAVRLDGLLLTGLKRFQSLAGLVPDGILGPETIINLNSAGGDVAPRLQHLYDFMGK